MIYVISIIVILVAVELLLRLVINKSAKKKLIESRKNAMDISLKQDFSKLAVTLKRVELQNPLARILLVDKDEQILDKLRSMLVIEGYSVDSVQSGKEAHGLSLVNHYDFIFTGEKTKDISSVELSNIIHERRKDISIVVMTEGIAAATPYDLIREGAIDFIQKPSVDNQLNEFVREQLKARRSKIDEELKSSKNAKLNGDMIPNGLFLTKAHLWISVEQNGIVKVGIDKFASQLLGLIDTIDFANLNIIVSENNPLFIIKKKFNDFQFLPNCQGRVVSANVKLREQLYRINEDPYKNWISMIEPDDISLMVKGSMIGKEANDYISQAYKSLKDDLTQLGIKVDNFEKLNEKLSQDDWIKLATKHLS